jgi:toxin-antitoxin system PIN domain toxin
MIAIDTNILVYSHRRDSAFFAAARVAVRECAEGSRPWAILWPCLHEFLAVVTNPRIFKTPTPLSRAGEQIAEWLRSPGVITLAEGPGYWETLAGLLAESRVVGGKVHDARVAALCIHHGVEVLWTADRDFSRFPRLRTHNPLMR